jgi:DNA-binding NtrC family response regulator
MPLQVLVVNTDRDALASMATALKAAGYVPTLTADFEDATAALEAGGFCVLLTAERLDAHNGLHLIMRARATRPTMGTIVTTPKADPALEAEATMFGAQCIIAPWDHPTDLLDTLARFARAAPT